MINTKILESIPKHVRVIAVSKLQSLEKIRAVEAATGHKDFGENYTQEALPKQEALKDLNLRWHLIGHLQTNKVKQAVGKFDLIHSVDSEKLILEIQKTAAQKNLRQKILLQVNVAAENSKEGFSSENILQGFKTWKALSHVEILGLMTMPPLVAEGHLNRPHFLKLKEIAAELGLPELSMGTSSDYQTAIDCGATLVRLGTVIFGER